MREELLRLIDDKEPLNGFNPEVIGNTEQAIENLINSDIFYTKFNLLKEYLRILDSRLSVKCLEKIQIYLEEMQDTKNINVSVDGNPFIHFLIREYYINIDEDLSITYSIFELIKKILKINLFDINSKDVDGNTGLMRLDGYKKFSNQNVQNGNKYLIVSNLDRLIILFKENGGVNEEPVEIEFIISRPPKEEPKKIIGPSREYLGGYHARIDVRV